MDVPANDPEYLWVRRKTIPADGFYGRLGRHIDVECSVIAKQNTNKTDPQIVNTGRARK